MTSSMVMPFALMAARIEVSTRLSALKVLSSLRITAVSYTHLDVYKRQQECNPEYIYGVLHPVPEELNGIRFFEEVPLGTGLSLIHI